MGGRETLGEAGRRHHVSHVLRGGRKARLHAQENEPGEQAHRVRAPCEVLPRRQVQSRARYLQEAFWHPPDAEAGASSVRLWVVPQGSKTTRTSGRTESTQRIVIPTVFRP